MYFIFISIIFLIIYIFIGLRYIKIFNIYKHNNGVNCKSYSKNIFTLLIVIQIILFLACIGLTIYSVVGSSSLFLLSVILFQFFFAIKTDNCIFIGFNPIYFNQITKLDINKIGSKYSISILYGKSCNARSIRFTNEEVAYNFYNMLNEKSLTQQTFKA